MSFQIVTVEAPNPVERGKYPFAQLELGANNAFFRPLAEGETGAKVAANIRQCSARVRKAKDVAFSVRIGEHNGTKGVWCVRVK